MNVDKILEQFDEQKLNMEKFLISIENTLKQLIDSEEILVHSITSRIKDRDSLKKKIEVKAKYKDISDITDICGIRIITFFSDEVNRIAEMLESEFSVDMKNSIDKREIDDPSKFGYVSLHYVLSLNDKRRSLKENEKFKNIKFEVQVRTILQHAWAEIEHDLGYKHEGDIPEIVKRKFARLAGLIELADDEFLAIKKTVDEYEKKVRQQNINKITKDTKIDLSTVSTLINSSGYKNFLDQKAKENNYDREFGVAKKEYLNEHASQINDLCKKLRISNLGDLAKIYIKFTKVFIIYISKIKPALEGKKYVYNYWYSYCLLFIVRVLYDYTQKSGNDGRKLNQITDKELINYIKQNKILH